MRSIKRSPAAQKKRRSSIIKLHPLFLLVGGWYACTGNLFLFLVSTLVALQHECAHAFAAAKLGYKLGAVVLMPFGAVIDGDLKGLTLKDEIFVALCGPLCNLVTALLFVALWWFFPSTYPFTDVAFYSSLAIALVNLLPCYPLDGGRVANCCLIRLLSKREKSVARAEKKARKLCRITTFLCAAFFLFLFIYTLRSAFNVTLLTFSLFLFFGGLGNRDRSAIYSRIELYTPPPLKKGILLKRVAISAHSPVKEGLRFLSREHYLVLEVYGEKELLFTLPQALFSELFLLCDTPYESFLSVYTRYQKGKNGDFFEKN